MAFGLKYDFTFKTEQDREWKVEIFQEGFVSAPETLTGLPPSPALLEYEQQDDLFFPIHGSNCTIKLRAPAGSDFKFEEFFDAEFADFKVVITDVASGNVLWEGFNLADHQSEPFVVTPYVVNVAFTDGLGRLKAIEFEASPGVFHTGTMHIIEVLRHCLNQINPLEIKEIFNVYENDHTESASDSPLVQTLVVSDVYRVVKQNQEEAMSCYDVIVANLGSIGAFVVQADQKWHIIRVRELQTSPLVFRDFLPEEGNEDDTTVNLSGSLINALDSGSRDDFESGAKEIVIVGQSAQLTQQKKVRRIIYRYRDNWWADFTDDEEHKSVNGREGARNKAGKNNVMPQHNGSILKNSNFDHDLGLSPHPLPQFWVESGSLTPAQMKAFANPATIRPGAKEFVNVVVVTPGSVFDSTFFMSQKIDTIFVDSADKIRLQFSYFLSPSTSTAYLKGFVKIKLSEVGTANIYYFKENGTWFQDNTGGGVLASVVFGVVPDTVDSITKTYHRLLANTANIPFKGEATLEVFFYRTAKIGTQSLNSLKLFDLKCLYHLTSGSLPPKEFIHVEEIDSVGEGETYEIDAFHNDSEAYVSIRSFRVDDADKNVTNDWHRTGIAENLNIFQILVNDVLALRSDYNKRLSGTFYNDDDIRPYSLISHDVTRQSGSTIWTSAIEGYVYDLQNSRYDASLIEMVDYSFSSTPSDFGNDVGEVGDQPSGGGGGTTGENTSGNSGFNSGGDEGSNFPN